MKKVVCLMNRCWQEILFICSLFVFIGCLLSVSAQAYEDEVVSALSEKVIRFHVIANSDTTQDQLLKQNVRDAVLLYMEPILKDSPDIEETRKRILLHQEEIKEVALQIVENWDQDYEVEVDLDFEHFPDKTYGDLFFPEGEYEACRIIIGEGKGQNWWCVMFPPLCYVDATTGVVPYEGKEALQENLTPEQYEIVAFQADKPYEVRFKLLEWLGE